MKKQRFITAVSCNNSENLKLFMSCLSPAMVSLNEVTNSCWAQELKKRCLMGF